MRGAGRAPCRQLRLCLVPCLLVAALAVTPIYDETLWTKVSWSKWKIDRDQFSISPSEETPGLLAQHGLKDVLHNSLEGPLPRPTKKTQKDPIIDAEALNDDTYLPAASMAVKCSVCHSLAVHVWRRLVDEVLRGNLSVQLAPLYVEKYMTEACENEVPMLLQRKVIYKLEVSSADQEMTFFVLRGRKPGTSPTWSEYAAVEAACKDLTYHDHQELARVLHTHLKDLKRSLNKLLRSYGMRDPYGVDLFGKDGEEEDEGGAAGAGSGATQAGSTDKGSTEAGSAEADSQAGSPKPMTAGKHGDAGKWGKKRSQKAGSGAGVPASEAEAAAETGIGGPAAEELPPLLKAAGIEEGDLPMAKQVLHEMAVKLLKGLAVQLRRDALAQLAQQEVAGGPGAALMEEEEEEEDDEEYQDPDDLDDEDEEGGEEVDEAGEPCRDLHPMCEQWANEGECDANPAYMVGNARLKGHCRKACGLCTPSARLSTPAELLASLPSLSKSMRELNKAVLKAVRSQVCTLRQACLSSGDEVAASGNVIAAKAPGYANSLQTFKGVPHGTGFVLGRPYWGVPEVKETPASKDVYQQQLAAAQEGSGAAAVGAAAADGSQAATGAGGGEDSSLEQLKRRVAEVLGAELGGKLLQMHEEFFTYEYLYKNHTQQFHDEPRLSGKKVTENWSLGTFSRESVVVESVLEQLDLLPAQTKADPGYGMSKFTWRYIKQVYNQGDVCQLGGGRTAVRRTEVRIACSPDSKIHLLIREPDFCQYVFVIYSPALCSLDHYKPQPKSSSAPR